MISSKREHLRTPLLLTWIAVLYFLEGLPFGVFFDFFPIWLRSHHFSLSTVGTLSLLGLAWSLKFLWASLIDHSGQHRWWIFGVNITMGVCLFLLSLQTHISVLSWVLLCVYVICSATNDISIDGLTIIMSGNTQMGRVNAIRNMAYRVGLVTAGGLLSLSQLISWKGTFLVTGILFWINSVVILFIPRCTQREAPVASLSAKQEFLVLFRHPLILLGLIATLTGMLWPAFLKLIPSLHALQNAQHVIRLLPVVLILLGIGIVSKKMKSNQQFDTGPTFGPFLRLLQKPSILGTIAFILLYKVGEAAAGFMIKPFWLDAGFSKNEIAWFSVNLGIILSISGGIVGGWYVDRHSVIRSLWVLGILSTFANLLYACAASIALPHTAGTPVQSSVRAVVYLASIFDSFSGGLGSAAFLAYLMKITNKKYATSEYAILTSIFAFSRSISGWLGGVAADSLGYSVYFLITFFLCYPAFLFMPFVKKTLEQNANN